MSAPETRESDPLGALAAPPVFIIGAHRSGTTWVFEALSAHPEVAGVYESGLFTAHEGFGGMLQEHLWQEDFKENARELTTHVVGPSQLVHRADAIAAVRGLSAKWLAEALGPGDRFLVEKTPLHYMAVRLIAEVFPAARFVHVLRDGRDVAVSMRAAGRSWQSGWRYTTYGPPWIAARAWANAVTTSRRELASIPNPSMELRYEHLRTDPVPELRRLFDFCEIEADEALVDDVAQRTSFSRHASTGAGTFRRSGQVDEWREAFGPVSRFIFNLAAADVLAETGYGPLPGPVLRRVHPLLDSARAKRDQMLGRRPAP